MLIVEDLEKMPELSHPVMAIGVFDGVHRGHQVILTKLVERARSRNGTAVVMSFNPHPQKIISPADAPLLLQTNKQKEQMLERLNVDVLIKLPFTRRFSLLQPEEFAREILHRQGISEVHVGSNFRFGHRRSGNFSTLQALGREFGFEVFEVEPVCFRGRRISSTSVRHLLKSGQVALAKRLLGRPYQIRGNVVRASRKGTELGFPTANLDPENELIPATGVYVTRVWVNGNSYAGATNIGYRPTVHPEGADEPVVETFLLSFEGDLYGKFMTLDFCLRLRSEKKFESLQGLKDQILRDVERTRRYSRRVASYL